MEFLIIAPCTAQAHAYVQLRQPFCINDVAAQWALLDRRAVYAILRENGIPTPPGLVFVNRDEQDEPPPRVEEVCRASLISIFLLR